MKQGQYHLQNFFLKKKAEQKWSKKKKRKKEEKNRNRSIEQQRRRKGTSGLQKGWVKEKLFDPTSTQVSGFFRFKS